MESSLQHTFKTLSTVSFHTLGCKLNFTETSTVSREFEVRGYEIVPFGKPADVVVINTCTVTEEANRKCRQTIRRAVRKSNNAFVIVTGCYAQLKPDEIASIDGVDLVLGANEKFELFKIAESFQHSEKTQVAVSCIDDATEFRPSHSGDTRTRAFLKVQDGCDYSCSFCTIPQARGPSRSAAINQIIEQAAALGESGSKEIILSGVNIGLFGNDTGEGLLQLFSQLDDVPSIERYRISSIEPNLLTDSIIDFVAQSSKFMPHFHIPLQSGDNEILGLMRRRYRRELYEARLQRIKSSMPHACIGSDVITGFPGETESHFLNTVAFLEDQPVSYLHVFSYSERPNTVAVDRLSPNGAIVDPGERSRRNRILTALSEKKRAGFYRSFLNTSRPVLWERGRKQDTMTGFTDNYIRVEQQYDADAASNIREEWLSHLTESGNVAAGGTVNLPVLT